MQKSYIQPILIFLLLALTVSCDTMDKEQYSPPPKEKPSSQADKETTVQPDKENRTPTPADRNIYNNKKDLWGWHTDDYIVLKWQPHAYSFFHVYKKTGKNGNWTPAYSGEISKNEFFERDIRDYDIISFKVEAVGRDGSVLHDYEPLTFYLDN